MARAPAKSNHLDVLIVGAHFSAHVAAAAIKHDHPKLSIAHVSLAGESEVDRLTMVNPKLFALHKVLEKLSGDGAFCPTFGLQFLSESAGVRGEFVSKTPTSLIVSTRWFTQAVSDVSSKAGVAQHAVKQLSITRVGDDGVEMLLDGAAQTARILILASPINGESRRALGIPPRGEDDVAHHYRFVRFKPPKAANSAKLVPMSLDLAGAGIWAWALHGADGAQLAVMQPARAPRLPAGRDVAAWIKNLSDHGLLQDNQKIPKPEDATTIALPVGGALVCETVANRTLLIGRAAGFVTACAEEIYPGCWSAVLAASSAAKALKERHLQDSLAGFRAAWGSTLGDYLRGPQQNLKLLLPLIYRNAIMSARVAEAILLGESVVR